MMKLKHLFNNEDLARMILSNWRYDSDSLDMFKYYRISSNAVYPFRENNNICFLRFAPISEKSLNNVFAELEFLQYLENSKYNAVEAVFSKKMNKLELVNTPWGEYIATVFKGVPGIQIDKTGFGEDIIFGYGESLGKLHRLSSEYSPKDHKRWSWKDVLEWTCNILTHFPNQALALKEVDILQDYLSKLPVSNKTFGLVHYDFETDNVFYDTETKRYYPIDFDDAMYHWYVMDIEQAINSFKDDIEQENYETAVKFFINGYRSQFDISDDMLSLMPVFRRFANLYGYARILYSTEEKLSNEPEWMINLRGYLEQLLKDRAIYFGENV